MPEQSHPPYESGAMTTPRQLYRWLDVNPQNGALTRTRKYIAIPAFNIPVTWLGYSEIVGEYHYAASNNFSLRVLDVADLLPSNPNYTCCISYVNADNTVVRYSLWRSPNDVIYFNLQPYTNQLIKKNFRIEIWSTNVASVSDIYQSMIYTSVLGSLDYRYGTDDPLVIAGPLCIWQKTTDTTALEPFNANDGSLSSWLNGNNWQDPTWPDAAGSFYSTNGSGVGVRIGINEVILRGSRAYIGTVENGLVGMFFNLIPISTIEEHIVLSTNDQTIFRVTLSATNQLKITVNDTDTLTSTALTSAEEYIVYLSVVAGTTYLIIYDLAMTVIYEGTMAHGVDLSGVQQFIVGDDFNVLNPLTQFASRGLVTYNYDIKTSDDDQYNQTLVYMQSLISNNIAMTLPLTWGQCAQPTFNN